MKHQRLINWIEANQWILSEVSAENPKVFERPSVCYPFDKYKLAFVEVQMLNKGNYSAVCLTANGGFRYIIASEEKDGKESLSLSLDFDIQNIRMVLTYPISGDFEIRVPHYEFGNVTDKLPVILSKCYLAGEVDADNYFALRDISYRWIGETSNKLEVRCLKEGNESVLPINMKAFDFLYKTKNNKASGYIYKWPVTKYSLNIDSDTIELNYREKLKLPNGNVYEVSLVLSDNYKKGNYILYSRNTEKFTVRLDGLDGYVFKEALQFVELMRLISRGDIHAKPINLFDLYQSIRERYVFEVDEEYKGKVYLR